MHHRRLALLALLGTLSQADAAELSIAGAFSGIAGEGSEEFIGYDPEFGYPIYDVFEGEPVTGQFAVHVSDQSPDETHGSGPDYVVWANDQVNIELSFAANGHPPSYLNFGSSNYLNRTTVSISSDESGQTLFIGSPGQPYWDAGLSIAGSAGLFNASLDPGSFDLTQIDLSRTVASFLAGRTLYAHRISIDSLTINGIQLSTPVPLPAGLPLLLSGLAGLLWAGRRSGSTGT